MTQAQRDILLQALIDFTVRVSSGGALPEEVQVLPAIAGALLSFESITSRI